MAGCSPSGLLLGEGTKRSRSSTETKVEPSFYNLKVRNEIKEVWPDSERGNVNSHDATKHSVNEKKRARGICVSGTRSHSLFAARGSEWTTGVPTIR